MTTPKTEGTFQLDGLLEGPLFTQDDASLLLQFVETCRKDKLHFALSLQANRFSLLAEPEIQTRPDHTHSVDALVTRHLDQLLSRYTPDEASRLMSTIRSVSITPGHETQTLYGIGPQGRIRTEQRSADCRTVPPRAPLTQRQKMTYGLTCIGLFILGLAISSWFVPYKEISSRVLARFQPYDVATLSTVSSVYDELFTIVSVTHSKPQNCFLVTCEVYDAFPTTEEAMNAAWIQTSQSMVQRLALESMARQRIRCIFYDDAGQSSGQVLTPMVWSQEHPKQFMLTLPFNRSTKRIELTYR